MGPSRAFNITDKHSFSEPHPSSLSFSDNRNLELYMEPTENDVVGYVGMGTEPRGCTYH